MGCAAKLGPLSSPGLQQLPPAVSSEGDASQSQQSLRFAVAGASLNHSVGPRSTPPPSWPQGRSCARHRSPSIAGWLTPACTPSASSSSLRPWSFPAQSSSLRSSSKNTRGWTLLSPSLCSSLSSSLSPQPLEFPVKSWLHHYVLQCCFPVVFPPGPIPQCPRLSPWPGGKMQRQPERALLCLRGNLPQGHFHPALTLSVCGHTRLRLLWQVGQKCCSLRCLSA